MIERGWTLFEAICDLYNLEMAWMDIWSGRTSAQRQGGAGVDGETLSDWETDWSQRLRALRHDLWHGTYRPAPLRRFEIPRRNAGSPRQLGIPTVRDRVAQRAVKNVLEPIWEDHFLSCSHGFRPGRSVFTAVAHVLWHAARGRNWVADTDIESCFDRIGHNRLLAQIEDLGDHRVTDLIAGWLDVGASAPRLGIAQGAVISPLLANIYLHPFDVAMIGAGWALVRYADDLVILCASSEEAEAALYTASEVLAQLDLDLKPEKTGIVPFGPDFSFLGARFIEEEER